MSRIEWLLALATVCSPAFVENAAQSLRAMVPLLDDYADMAFCKDSLLAVAQASRRQSVPAIDEIRAPLSAWWKENRPYQAAIAATDRQGLTPDQRAHVACCLRRIDAGANPRTVLSIVRTYSGRSAMLSLIAERPQLEPIARAAGWLDAFLSPIQNAR